MFSLKVQLWFNFQIALNIFLIENSSIFLGNGLQRPLECSSSTCHGQALDQKLLSPVSVVAGADGSIFVGDFDLIRRIMPDGMVVTLLKLASSGVAHRYGFWKLFIGGVVKHSTMIVFRIYKCIQ